jgi:predicted ATPase
MSNTDMLVGQRYRILKTIGTGGMGVVYQALDIETNQLIALKLLKPEVLIYNPDLLERFKREGEALSQLNHPNIVKMLTAFEENNQHYIVMEYVSGGSLANFLAKQPRPPINYIVKVALEVADALSRAHHLKIIHRDIKPDNVLLAEDGTPRLTDFGIAHLEESKITQTGIVMGTVPYVCPEVLNNQTPDTRTDIWAFGVMLFEMLAGKRPFEGDTLAAITAAILTKPTPDLEAPRPDAPIALVDLVYRMLEKNPDERISSVRQVGAALESIMSGVDTPIHPIIRLPLPANEQGIAFQTTTALSITKIRTNLPAQTTPFVGREDELAEVARLLASPANRLLTILGTGGMGKTRLSLEVAVQQIDHFPDGVYFVELAPLSSPEHIVAAVAEAIGVQFAQGSDPKQQLLNAFHDRKILLVMDNFEHLLDGTQIIQDILQADPNVKILTTSRERLNLSGETLFTLSGMDFSDWETPEDALNYGVVKLFMQSARRAKPDFTLLADDLKFLARICRLVAGMPLGIVLTAAWVSMLSLEEIANELAQSLDFLETDLQDIPERQRSIRNVFEHSYHRLTADEQCVFRSLSVFRGGFTRDAAQTVTGASLKNLLMLMNKSLLRRDPQGRYQIHELLRQFGEQELINTGEAPKIPEAHATFFAHFLSSLWEDLKGQRQVGALADIQPEYENVRVAWRWLVEHQRSRELGEAASSLWFYLEISSNPYEGIDLFGQAVESLRAASNDWVLGHLLGRLSWFQVRVNQYKKGKANAEQACAILREANQPEAFIMALNSLANAYANTIQYGDLLKVGEEAFRLAQEENNAWAMRLSLERRIGGLYFTGNGEEAIKLMGECLTLSLAAGDFWMVGICYNGLAFAAMEGRNFQEVERLSRQALQTYEPLHIREGISVACIRLGASLAHQGPETDAKSYFHRGIKTSYDLGVNRQTLILILTSIEEYFSQRNKPFAVELLAMMLNNPACDSTIAGWTEKTIVALKTELSPEGYEAAWQRGAQWNLDHAVALILERLSENT